MNKLNFEPTHRFAGPCPLCKQDRIAYNIHTKEAACESERVWPLLDEPFTMWPLAGPGDPPPFKPARERREPCWRGRIEIHDRGIKLIPQGWNEQRA